MTILVTVAFGLCCARQAFETDEIVDPSKRHMMRTMLTANLALDQRFANGTQGRIMMFFPKKTRDKRAALASCHQDLMARCVKQIVLRTTGLLISACSARFLKESSVNKRELFPDTQQSLLVRFTISSFLDR